jgi:putative flavoprotein involved in K+ transport
MAEVAGPLVEHVEGMSDAAARVHRIDTVIVGGGQTGLAVGYHLARADRRFVILDAHPRVGDAWRKRWDSLRLFTPAKFNGLPGMPCPSTNAMQVVHKDAMANYLEAYARRFDLPVVGSCRVQRLTKEGQHYRVDCGADVYVADNVVVAMAGYQRPYTPGFASKLAEDTVQLHSSAYKNSRQLRPGSVLVVGTGNSGADIAMELSSDWSVWLSGRDVGEIPFRIDTGFALRLGIPMVRFLGHHILCVHNPIGRKIRPKFLKTTSPRVRVKMRDLLDAGVKRVPRVAGVREGKPVLEDGQVVDVDNVVWCTGYESGFRDWIDLPIFASDGKLIHERGLVDGHPGLFFAGQKFQTSATSDTVTGMPRDARFIADAVCRRTQAHLDEAPTSTLRAAEAHASGT